MNREMHYLSRSTLATAVMGFWLVSGWSSQAGITWTGAVNDNWDSSTANWSGDSTTFTDDGTVDVTFNSSSGGTITISPNMSPTSMTVSASSGTYTFTGGPIDSGTLTKSGNGTLEMRGAHTFTGKTTVLAGQITVRSNFYAGTASALGAPTGPDAIIDMHAGTTMVIAQPSGTDGRNQWWSTDRIINLAGAAAGTVRLENAHNDYWCEIGGVSGSGTGPRTFEAYVRGDGGQIRISGPITDTSDDKVTLLVKFNPQSTRTGKLYLPATNTFSGPLNITTTGGQLPGTVLISGGGLLGGGNFTNTISISNNRIFNYASTATQELSGMISGGGALVQSGTGSLTLSAANTYAGGTTINNGTLYAGATGALGTGDVAVASSALLVMTEDNAMSSGATLTLPNDSSEWLVMNTRKCVVAALVINSVAQPVGTYWASSTDWMGGNGRLYVGIPAAADGTVIQLY